MNQIANRISTAVLALFFLIFGAQIASGDSCSPPVVETSNTYPVSVSTHIYAQGMVHQEWGDTTGAEVDLLLDLYLPEGAPGLRPAAIVIHGGGFIGGSREKAVFVDYAETLAARGWVCISVDYRVARDRGTIPSAWQRYADGQTVSEKRHEQALAIYPASRDVKAALRWLTSRATELSINTDYITAIGGSAGAVLAIMLGTTEPQDFRSEVPVAADPTLSSATLDSPSGVHTIIDFWGSAVAVEILEAVWDVARFDSNDAPLLIFHGTRDATVSYSEATNLEQIWTSTGVPFEFHTLDGAGHGAWNETIRGRPLLDVAVDFIVKQQGLIMP